MSFNLIRLTLYGLIVAIDMDLRNLVKDHLGATRQIDELLPTDLMGKVRDRASRDGVTNDDEFYDYLDFSDSIQVLNSNKLHLDNTLIKFMKSNAVELERLVPIRNRVMHARPLQFNDYTTVDEFVRKAISFPRRYFPRLFEFEEKVRENPNYVYSLDLSQVGEPEDRIPHNLPLPDYDETGFLGREQEAADLLAACRSNWPVVTVVGEGGFGKTALALKVAYELLDDPASGFEAIVWVTAKRTVLTLNDIQLIDGAIQDSLGLIRGAAHQLGALSEENTVLDEVASYLNTFKILLVLDNLETVLDPLLTRFIRKSNGKSKILATSRVGIGEMSYPFRLGGLGPAEAVQLLRATAKVRRVPEVYRAKNDILRHYVQQMKLNAGFIKWFVATVQVGKRPDQALSNPKTFLDFCLSNVYEHVSANGRQICKAMLAVPGRHSLALISYLSGLSGDDLQEALAGLQSANIVAMTSVLTEAGAETAFELNELPRLYILRNHAPTAVEDATFKSKKREVSKLYEKVQSERAGNRYSMRSIACRNPADAITGKLLSDALACSAADDRVGARRLVDQAKELDPSFYEVYRVEGAVEAFSDRPALADAAYQYAIALEPNSAPVRYWYAGFLLRISQDSEAAERELLVAEALDSDSPSILIELARVKMYLGQFDEADRRLQEVFCNLDASTKQLRIAYDTWLQVPNRQAIADLESGRYSDCLEACKIVPTRFQNVPAQFLDEKIVNTAKRTLDVLARLIERLALSSLRPEAEDCYETINGISSEISKSLELHFSELSLATAATISMADAGRKFDGIVHNVNLPKRYGFISYHGQRIFFHFSTFFNAISQAKPGIAVEFTVGERNGRFCAVDVRPMILPGIDEGQIISAKKLGRKRGHVRSILIDKHFGFLTTLEGDDLFFHRSNVISDGGLEGLSVGAAVSFSVGRNHKGIIADEVSRDLDS